VLAAAQNLYRQPYRNGPVNLNSGGVGDALELARATDTPMRLGALCEKEMIEAIARGWADRDATIFLTLQVERTQAKLSGAAPNSIVPPDETPQYSAWSFDGGR